jgi:hypothetical protein
MRRRVKNGSETMTRTISEEETETLLYWLISTQCDINEATRARTFQVAIERARQWLWKRGER